MDFLTAVETFELNSSEEGGGDIGGSKSTFPSVGVGRCAHPL